MNEEEQNREEFREKILEKLQDLKDFIVKSISPHEIRLTKLEASVNILEKLSWALFATSLLIVLTAFWKMILK